MIEENKKNDHVYREEDLDLSFYDNNVPDIDPQTIIMSAADEVKLQSVDTLNRYYAVLGNVKIERF